MHSAELGAGGIDGRREDGTNVLVMWRDVVGLVVRLAPPEYDGHPIVDLISVGGSTLRLVPWTRLSGELVELEGEPRIRAFVALVLERVPAVQLDRATRAFVDELGPPRQLADREMLAAHDARIR